MYSGQQQMQKIRVGAGAENKCLWNTRPKWGIDVMPAPANTQERRGRKTLRARGWGRLQKNSVFWTASMTSWKLWLPVQTCTRSS